MAAGTLASLLIKLGVDASGVAPGIATAEKGIGRLGTTAGQTMRVAGALIGGGLAFAAKGAAEMENRAAQFQAETGASADEARHFEDVLNSMAGSSLVSMDDLANSASKIRTDLGLTGDAADAALQQFAKYERATNQGADAVAAFDDIQDAWNLTSADTLPIMDTLIAGQQKYGGSIQDSQSLLAKLAPVLQGANMDWKQGAEFINLFNAAGVDGTAAITGIGKALGKVKSPEELQKLLTDISAIQDPFEQTQAAIATFGTKAGPKLAQALRASGGDLSQFGFSLDEVKGKTDAAADALDNTLTSKFKMGINFASSLLRGFGMSLGPILTGAVSAISFGKALGLDKLLGPALGRGKEWGASLAQGIAGGVKGALGAFGGVWNKIAGGAQSAGSIAGGKFGMAFKLAAGVGLALMIADEIKQLGEVRQANVEKVADISASMKKLLDEAPTRAEAEAKLAGLKAVPENLNGIQGAVMDVANLGKGNVLGSVFDGLFGANPAAVLDEQTKALEDYIAGLPAETAPAAAAAGQAVGTQVTKAVTAGLRHHKPAKVFGMLDLSSLKGSIAEIRTTITNGLDAATNAADAGMDLINNALNKPPKLISYEKRMKMFARAQTAAWRHMRAALKANDPAQASYWESQYIQIAGAAQDFKGTTTKTMGQIKADLAAANVSAGGSLRGIRGHFTKTANHAKHKGTAAATALPTAMTAATPATATATAGLVSAVTTPMSTLPGKASTWGEHAGEQFASNLQGAVPETANAASNIASAVARFIAFSTPPREGALHGIRSWGPHMVDHWVQTTEASLGKVHRTAGRLAGAMAGQSAQLATSGAGWHNLRGGPAGGAVGRSGGPGGDVHIHVGTLIANDAGLDELERRMSKRRRFKSREPRRYNDPS